ncbi:Putative Zinc finger C2H2-type [Septoria linicola]|uniref:Zinc finger C2H2-type n=1 Tax=Septoria linicola TaxID=215465 RepID=A0A9Q9B8M9_9PEZI|nr:putative Zinc finger C2H2-type [Septoria linicola]USW59413.1 Putative Zinc finger C2H2-type [Septoria linicola]
MSGYYFQPPTSSGEQYYNFDDPFQLPYTTDTHTSLAAFAPLPYQSLPEQQTPIYSEYPRLYQRPPQAQEYHVPMPIPEQQPREWEQRMISSNGNDTLGSTAAFPSYADVGHYGSEAIHNTSSRLSIGYLSPELGRPRVSRATSVADSVASSALSTRTDFSRGASPSATEMSKWGTRNSDNSWSCAYPGCASKSRFNRGCDLRKHYKRHTKSLYCRHKGCPQATEGGFSSKKDRARHEAKHNPTIQCECDGCERLFSRQDNMKDHVRRVHKHSVH